MGYKRYEKYKDSGVEWIGEIPEGWSIKKLKYVSAITMGQSPKSENYNTDGIGKPFLQGNAEFTNFYPIPKYYCPTANKFSKPNDILLSVRAPVGAMNISDSVYGIGRGLCAITARKINMKYLWYGLNVCLEELRIKSKGSTYDAITVANVNNLLMLLPLENEQISIANFLDQKTAEIDSLIADKEKLIQLLQEKRQAIITEAVTKGLDPNVPMKDSGVEWIGEIPNHWEVKRLKFTLIPGKNGIRIGPFGSSLKLEEMDEDYEYKVYGQENIINNDFSLGNRNINSKKYKEMIAYEISPGDIIISMMGTIGRCKVVPENIIKGVMDSHLIRLRTDKAKLSARFLEYLIDQSHYIKTQIYLMSKGSIMNGLNSTIIKELYLALPEIEEQKNIVNYLKDKTSEIDNLIYDIQTQIAKLREYRQSLISEAVTGKIDVRNFTPSTEGVVANA